MTKQELTTLLDTTSPIILLEGRRNIPADMADQAAQVAEWLANSYPHARFRSGNATGSDEAFSQGVIQSDPTRLEIFAPSKTHRAKHRHPEVTYLSPAELTEEETEHLAELTNRATPKNANLINRRHLYNNLKAKANYLLRDTLKAIGSQRLGYERPTLALFYVDPADPMDGGTGHTIRVCQNEQIPVLTQHHWSQWVA